MSDDHEPVRCDWRIPDTLWEGSIPRFLGDVYPDRSWSRRR